jgi:pyruvate dehydrogenase E1 component alpha subunit
MDPAAPETLASHEPAAAEPGAPDAPDARGESLAARARRDAYQAAPLLHRHMLRLRMLSARMVDLQREGRIAFHASILGEEAAVVAAALAARATDWVFPGTREWGVGLVRGLSLAAYAHHAFGTAEDAAKGHAPPDHPVAKSQRVAPASGVVGAHVPQAVGFAWAARTRREDVVTLAVFGDGATSTGDFHNALNFAGVFRAPCVFVCRNNGRAGASPTSRQTRTQTLAEKAVAYGIASARVTGTDAVETLAVLREAVLRAADGKGATLVEVLTHPPETLDDVDLFALPGEDALAALRSMLVAEGRLDAASDSALRARIGAEIDAAVAEASAASPPAPATLFDDVYARIPSHLEAQRALATTPSKE